MSAAVPLATTIAEGDTFPPWGIDTLATVHQVDKHSITLTYDHDPRRTHTLPRREISQVGRFVDRKDYR